MIKVLVVDDSNASRELIAHILESDKDIKVIGTANNGKEAIEFVKHTKPDLITIDIHMPYMDGFQATREIMRTERIPIVIVTSSFSVGDTQKSFKALEAGALTIVGKPMGIGHPLYEETKNILVTTVRLMSEIKVVRRRYTRERTEQIKETLPQQLNASLRKVDLVVIGVSTGGPIVLQEILSRLPASFSVPIVIVQHIAHGFLVGLVDWLNESSKLKIRVAQDGENVFPGSVYFAKENYQLKVTADGKLIQTNDPMENFCRPSVSYLFRNTAQIFGDRAMGILLTGMGKDGANELKMMRDNGAVTIAQNEESSMIFGMPAEAIKLGGAEYIFSPFDIVETLKKYAPM